MNGLEKCLNKEWKEGQEISSRRMKGKKEKTAERKKKCYWGFQDCKKEMDEIELMKHMRGKS